MRTPSPKSENYRHDVQARVQNLVSGQRQRHPVLSQYSTRRLILEAVVEEVRIYRLKKEAKVLQARGTAIKMAGDNGQTRRRSAEEVGIGGGHENGESSHWGRRGKGQRDQNGNRASNMGERGKSKRKEDDPEYLMTGGGSGAPPPVQQSTRPKHASPRTTKRDGYTRLQPDSPGEGDSSGQQRLDRNGKPLVRGERGWRDASPRPFPEYKFKVGPMFGLGDHIRERYRWGMDSYILEQRRKERRGRGTLDERKKVRNEKRDREDRKMAAKSEGERAMSDKPPRRHPKQERSPMRVNSGSHLDAYLQAEQDGRTIRGHHDQKRQGERVKDQKRKGLHQGTTYDSRRKAPFGATEHATLSTQAEDDVHSRNIDSRNPNIEGGKSYTSRGSIHLSTRRLDPQIPTYGQTPYSQRVEARERAETENARTNKDDSSSSRACATIQNQSSSNEGSGHRPDQNDVPQHLGSTASMVTQWWSDRSESPIDNDRRDVNNSSEDELAISDHFFEELRSRAGSLSSRPYTLNPQAPTIPGSGYRELSPLDESGGQVSQAGRLREDQTRSQVPSAPPSPDDPPYQCLG